MNDRKSAAEMRPKISRKALLASTLLVLFIAVFFSLYLQNLPYEQEAGVAGWWRSAESSWSQLLGYLFTPVSVSPTANNAVLIQSRVTESLFHKAVFDIFGDSMVAMASFNLTLAILFAWVVFGITKKWTGSIAAGFLTAVFLMTTPAYGWTLAEYGDYSPLDQILLILYFAYFIAIYEHILNGNTRVFSPGWIFRLAGLWLIGMLAVRSKETNKFLVPGISWILVFLNPGANILSRHSRKILVGFLSLCLILLLLTLPVILVGKGSSPAEPLKLEYLKAPLYLFFWNPFTVEAKHPFTLFSLKRIYGASVLANFGFFLSWLLIGCGIFWAFRRKRTPPSSAAGKISVPFFLAAWTLFSLSFYIVYRNFDWTRYLIWALLPFTLLAAVIFTRFLSVLSHPLVRRVFGGTILLFSALSVVGNLEDSLYVRKYLEAIWVPKYTFRKEVYKDYKRVENPGFFEYMRWWYPRNSYNRRVEPYLERDKDWTFLAKDEKFAAILKEFGIAYAVGTLPPDLPWKTVLIKTLRQEDFSLLTGWKLAVAKKKSPKRFYLYRVELTPSPLA